MSKRFSLLKILIVVFLRGGESSNNSILVFFSYFFDRSSSLNDSYLLCWGTSRGAGRERGEVCVGGAGRGHVAFLPAAKATSFFETLVPFFWGKLLWFFIGVNVHGVGVPGGWVPCGGGGVEGDWGSGRMLFGDGGRKASLAEELVYFLIPSFGRSRDYFHPVDSV